VKYLGFEPQAEYAGGRRVRRARFEPRSSFPISAACLIANGVRECLAGLLGTGVALRLLEPVLPPPAAWAAIGAGAHVYGVRGAPADAAFVLRPADALALAAAAFGEEPEGSRPISPLEGEVVQRALRALAPTLAPVCGTVFSPSERILDISTYTTYFELLVEQPVRLRIGVAVSREPAPKPGPTIRPEDLLDVTVEARVRFACGRLTAAAVLDLGPGVLVPMTTRVGERALLVADGAVLARGECGMLGERHAMIVETAA
jgi:flagellar motor switch/type III secretory pathway protein FliN